MCFNYNYFIKFYNNLSSFLNMEKNEGNGIQLKMAIIVIKS